MCVFIYLFIFLCAVLFSLDTGLQQMTILWQRLHGDMKSLLSWQYLMRDIQLIRSWNITIVSSHPVFNVHDAFYLFILQPYFTNLFHKYLYDFQFLTCKFCSLLQLN